MGFTRTLGFYITGLANTVGAILAIDGRSRQSWLFLPTHPPLGSIEGSTTSDAVKHAGIEHVSDWSGLQGFLKKVRPLPPRFITYPWIIPSPSCRLTLPVTQAARQQRLPGRSS